MRGIDQARHFEEVNSLRGQLRAVDHILEKAELNGPTPEQWMAEASDLLKRLADCRAKKQEDGFNATDIEKMHSAYRSFPYQEHFAPVQRIDPTPLMSEHYRHGDPSAT